MHGVVHGCGDGPAVVMCEPFAEEAKCAHRVLTELAWALAGHGLRVLRFDYRGCGDSEGWFEDFDLDAWRADVRGAVAWARQRLKPSRLALVGLRLGAALAAEAVEEVHADALVLLAPVIDGAGYWRENFRRTLIKAKLTEGDHVSADELRKAEEEEYFDLAGWLVPRAMREQIQRLRLAPGETVPAFSGPCLVLDITARHQPGPKLRELASRYPHGQARSIRMEPFWQRIGLVDAAPLCTAMVEWLPAALGGGAGHEATSDDLQRFERGDESTAPAQ